jgi:type I restriction enzyme S subunit
MTRIGDIGTPALVQDNRPLAFYVSLALIRLKTNIILSEYLYYYIQTIRFKKELWNRTIHNAFPIKINKNEIGNCRIFIPTLDYQKKIIELFKIIDEKLYLTTTKLETLKKYKKGLQKFIFNSNKNDKFELLKNSVVFEPKSNISAGSSIEDGKYVLYKSGQKNGTLNTYTNEGIYIIANDGGEASFKLTNGRFSYTDHCICFKCDSDEKTITLANYLQVLEKKITYIGFTGTGLKNIDRQYLGMIKIPILDYKKIAESFCIIDKAILNNEHKLECLSKFKKQLLQSMFI